MLICYHAHTQKLTFNASLNLIMIGLWLLVWHLKGVMFCFTVALYLTSTMDTEIQVFAQHFLKSLLDCILPVDDSNIRMKVLHFFIFMCLPMFEPDSVVYLLWNTGVCTCKCRPTKAWVLLLLAALRHTLQ